MKNVLSVVAAGDQVIKTALQLDPKIPRHTLEIIARISQNRRRDTGFSDSATPSAGQTVRSQDAWGRERWARTDDFGRLVEVVEPDPTGNATVAASGTLQTTYAYNQSDELITITQGSQTRSFKYDSLGRLIRQKL